MLLGMAVLSELDFKQRISAQEILFCRVLNQLVLVFEAEIALMPHFLMLILRADVEKQYQRLCLVVKKKNNNIYLVRVEFLSS